MKPVVPLALFTILSTGLAVVHNHAVADRRPSPVTFAVLALLSPGQRAATAARRGVTRWMASAAGAPGPSDQVDHLRAELDRLQARVAAVESENQRLAHLAGLSGQIGGRSIGARVIGLGTLAWTQSATIDRGYTSGVRPRDVVVTDEGVVGQVTGVVGPTSAVALFLTDPSSSVGVRVEGSGVLGIARGEGGATLQLTYLDKSANIRKGDAVETSGLGGIFPAGLYIGRILDVQTDASGAGRTARVEPVVGFSRLSDLLVLGSTPPVAGTPGARPSPYALPPAPEEPGFGVSRIPNPASRTPFPGSSGR